MTDTSTVFIIDDDLAIRDSLTMLLETAGYSVKSFASAREFLGSYVATYSGCILLDVKMPDMDGPTLQAELIRRDINLPIIFLSAYGTIPAAVKAIKVGAMDFLTKPVDASYLCQRVQQALLINAEARKKAKERQLVEHAMASLTEREREIMSKAVEGYSNKEIARQLGISPRTVEVHRAHIFQKTGAANLLDLAHMVSLSKSN